MRTLKQILAAATNDGRVSREEYRYAVVTLAWLQKVAAKAIEDLAHAERWDLPQVGDRSAVHQSKTFGALSTQAMERDPESFRMWVDEHDWPREYELIGAAVFNARPWQDH